MDSNDYSDGLSLSGLSDIRPGQQPGCPDCRESEECSDGWVCSEPRCRNYHGGPSGQTKSVSRGDSRLTALVAELNQRFRFQLAPCSNDELKQIASEFDLDPIYWLAGDARIAEACFEGSVPAALIVHTNIDDRSIYGLYLWEAN